MSGVTSDRLEELHHIAAETTPGTHEWRIIETALALAEKAFRDHAATCSYYDWEPEACPICKRLIRARDEARRRALAAMDMEH